MIAMQCDCGNEAFLFAAVTNAEDTRFTIGLSGAIDEVLCIDLDAGLLLDNVANGHEVSVGSNLIKVSALDAGNLVCGAVC